MLTKRFTNLLRQGFTAQRAFSNRFDYEFESKIDHGNFPHNFHSYMRVLDEEVDKNSE